MIAKIMSPIITGASISIRKTTIAIITIKAIIPIIIVPIDAHPKSITNSMLLHATYRV
jgi:hypothetical protein